MPESALMRVLEVAAMSDSKGLGQIILMLGVLAGCAQVREPVAPAGAAGASATVSSAVNVGATASAKLLPLMAAADGDGVTGSATFTVTTEGVNAEVWVMQCKSSRAYAVQIYAGNACTSAVLSGPVWDGTRGLGIDKVACLGVRGGDAYHVRRSSDPKPWTIGGPATSNLIGHAIAALDPDTLQPVACGQIVAGVEAPIAGAGVAADSVVNVRMEVRAQFAGWCLAQKIVKASSDNCPNPQALIDCSETRCQLSTCLASCADYAACLDKAPDPCAAMSDCAMSAACTECNSKLVQCSLNLCFDVLACAPPITPDGPCVKLEACCASQAERAEVCLDLVKRLERLSGDPSCYGVMFDEDFKHNLINDTPECDFGAVPAQ
jgi:hypothetical protein